MPQGTAVDEGVRTASTPPRRRRRSETRQRTEQVKVRFLPSEHASIEEAARSLGFTGPGWAQRYMRHLLGFEDSSIAS